MNLPDPLIDSDTITNFKAAVGDDDFERLAKSCIATTTATLDDLVAAIEKSDEEAVRFGAHALSGLFSQFGMPSLGVIARSVERMEASELFITARSLVPMGRRGMEELKALADATECGQ
jgi:hypothetical protein